MKNILIPTDFSECAWNATVYALNLYRDTPCNFHFLNTYMPPIYRFDYVMGGPAYSAIPDKKVDLSLSGLDRVIAKVEKEYANPKHEFSTISSFNTLVDEVKEVCEARNIELIVMGTQGASGAKEVFLGSNTVHVLRKSKIPVLAVPKECVFEPIENIVFATDYLSKYKSMDLETFLSIAARNNSCITCVHVFQQKGLSSRQRENEKNLQEILEPYNTVYKNIKGHMPEAIINYIEMNKVQLLAMVNHEHSFLEKLIVRQNIDTIGFHTSVPFMVLRDPKRN